NDIWKASSSAGTIGITRWREMPLSGVLNWWWGLWIAGGSMAFVGRSLISNSHSSTDTIYEALHHQRSGLWWDQVALAVTIVAGILAIIFVREVTRLQDEHFGPGA